MTDPIDVTKCPSCGRTMRPLFTGYYCPGDCDRKKASTVDDDWSNFWEAPTPQAQASVCPKCYSHNTAPFMSKNQHCWDCGHVW